LEPPTSTRREERYGANANPSFQLSYSVLSSPPDENRKGHRRDTARE